MKKILAVLLGVLLLLITAWAVAWGLAVNAERRAAISLASIAPDATATARYPLIAAKNQSATTVEELAAPLGIDMKQRSEGTAGKRPEFDGTLKQSISDWLMKQQERPSDAIDPLPENVRAWLERNRSQLDRVASFLAANETPRWPQVEDLPRERLSQPIPNLLGHITLARILTVAALDSAAAGDQARAWEMLHASWNLLGGLRERREVISQLIAVAEAKMLAASARKLDAPVPPWFGQVVRARFADGVYDAIGFDAVVTAAAIQEKPTWTYEVDDDLSAVDQAGMTILWPVVRWAAAEHNRALGAHLPALRKSPCTIDTKAFLAQMQGATSPWVYKIGQAMHDYAPSAMWRGANADLTMEGTNRILALKEARRATPGQRWPAAFAEEASSLCPGERWSYSVDPEGGASLRFTHAIDYSGVLGPKIPAEYTAAAM